MAGASLGVAVGLVVDEVPEGVVLLLSLLEAVDAAAPLTPPWALAGTVVLEVRAAAFL